MPSEPHHDLLVRGNKLQLLYHQSFHAVFVSLVTALVVTSILWAEIETTVLLIWLGAVAASSMIRFTLFMTYFRAAPEGAAILAWEKPYFITLLLSASVWGVGSLLIMPADSLLYQAIIYCFLMGMAGGALSVYSAIRLFAITTIAMMLLPVTTWFITQGNTTSVMLGVGGCIFFLSALRATRVLSSALHCSFELTHELTEAKESAEFMARTDTLTGFNNRRSFTELANAQINHCRRHGQPVSLLVLDIDDFKSINDSRGHSAGDLALQHFSHCTQSVIRASDICGRIGGEEFAVALPNATLGNAKIIAEKIRIAISEAPVQTSSEGFCITSSIGVATGNADIEQLLGEADAAMYEAKKSGKNRVVCHESWVGSKPG
jgi:diguanylate cyclase (GGDEF)-like protein